MRVVASRERSGLRLVPADKLPLRLRLYIVGSAPNSLLATAHLQEALEGVDPGSYELEVVDCLVTPQNVFDDGIVVTPTLLRLGPGPMQVMVGTLSDRDKLLTLLRTDARE